MSAPGSATGWSETSQCVVGDRRNGNQNPAGPADSKTLPPISEPQRAQVCSQGRKPGMDAADSHSALKGRQKVETTVGQTLTCLHYHLVFSEKNRWPQKR